ncbi:MAG: methyltransferase domain-containing protein [Gammaproteobacteria bacterium]|jgi:cyclopropane fatty-acyl-phospholipid synthase-like methyltransferase
MSATLYHYDNKALNTLAILFAPGFVHLGSEPWIHNLCRELNLSGQKVLDFGAGAGGPACYIAKQFDAQVLGLEFSPLLLESAKQLALQNNLSTRVEFAQIHDPASLGLTQKFDLIYSINSLSHCKDKELLFAQLSSTLRSNGTLAIMDWFHKSPNYSEATQAFFKFTDDIFYLNTPQEYLQRLEKNKLSYVNFKDTTKSIRQECEALIQALKTTHQGEIIASFGAEYYEWWVEYWSLLYAAMQSGDLIKGHVQGVKV